MFFQKLMSCSCGKQYQEESLLVLRVVTGFAFFYHGYAKVFNMGMETVTGFLSSVGIPAAGLFAYLVSYGELLGGLALMFGFFTHLVSKINVLIMLGAIGFVHFANGYNGAEGGYEYQLLLLAASIFFVVTAPGKYSLDAKCASKCSTATAV